MRLLFAFLLVPALASAGPAKTAEQKHTDDCAAARKANRTCVLDMGKEDVTGTSPLASGIGVASLKLDKQPSLLPIRHDFIVEIIKSAEDLP